MQIAEKFSINFENASKWIIKIVPAETFMRLRKNNSSGAARIPG
jgi:hypothetical protein